MAAFKNKNNGTWYVQFRYDTMKRLWIAANRSVLQADTLSSPVPPDIRL